MLNDVPGLSINTILPVTDPIVSNGGIVSIRLTKVRGRIDGPPGPQDNPHFVPEPELLPTLGSGGLLLAWLGRRRMRR